MYRQLQYSSLRALSEQHYASDSPRDAKILQELGSLFSSRETPRFMNIILAEKV